MTISNLNYENNDGEQQTNDPAKNMSQKMDRDIKYRLQYLCSCVLVICARFDCAAEDLCSGGVTLERAAADCFAVV